MLDDEEFCWFLVCDCASPGLEDFKKGIVLVTLSKDFRHLETLLVDEESCQFRVSLQGLRTAYWWSRQFMQLCLKYLEAVLDIEESSGFVQKHCQRLLPLKL